MWPGGAIRQSLVVRNQTDAPKDAPSDAALVAATQAGDLSAFAELSRRYRDRYMRFAVRMVGSHDDAEDALQSAFIRASRPGHEAGDAAGKKP